MKKVVRIGLVLTMMALCVASAFAGGSNESAGSPGKTYTVGICQLVQHNALDAATKGFEDALRDKLGDSVKIIEQNASGDVATCITIVNGFVSSNVNLIMANATPALQAAQAATGDIPILGTSVTDYGTALGMENFTGTTGVNISGTSDLAPLDQQANMIMELFPSAKKVGMLYCSAEANSVYQVNIIKAALESHGIKCQDFAFSDSNDVSAVTANACSWSDVIYIPTDNTAASCTETIRNVVEPAKVPVVVGEEGICKGCGVATLSISYYDLGYRTGEMAAEILSGADVSTMPILYAPKFTKEYNAELCSILGVEVPEDYVAI